MVLINFGLLWPPTPDAVSRAVNSVKNDNEEFEWEAIGGASGRLNLAAREADMREGRTGDADNLYLGQLLLKVRIGASR